MNYRSIANYALAAIIATAPNAALAGKRAAADDDKALIKEALSAAPKAIAKIAAVKNWDGRTLKEGSSDWICYPSMPQFEGVCPMCIDKPWQGWLESMSKGEAPSGGSLGISYMLQGDCAVSNTDPMATAATDDNEWGQEGPHLMLLAPDAASLEGMSHDRNSGAPYVMWRDTPYAHIMAPLPAAHH